MANFKEAEICLSSGCLTVSPRLIIFTSSNPILITESSFTSVVITFAFNPRASVSTSFLPPPIGAYVIVEDYDSHLSKASRP